MASTQSIDAEKAREFAVKTVRKLREANFISYWAGGCVRDHHLQVRPKDFDVATNALPDEIQELFGKKRTLAIGASFGVITLIGSKEQGNIEIATFREDESYTDGRRPDKISFSTPEADAHRRDFTINGMFLDPETMETLDYVGGLTDLKARQIQAIGDPAERFEEDKLRIFRAIRFATTLNFQIERNTLDAVCRHVDNLNQVSRERILVELEKTLSSQHRLRGIDLLCETGILPYVLPKTNAEAKAILLLKSVLAQLPANKLALTFAAIYHILSPELTATDIRRTIKSMKTSNEVAESAFWILQHITQLISASTEFWPKVQRTLVHPLASDTLALAKAIVLTAKTDPSGIQFCEEKLALSPEDLNPSELLSGADLIELGMTPGPTFSKVLKQVRDQQLQGKVNSIEQALELAKITYQSMGQ